MTYIHRARSLDSSLVFSQRCKPAPPCTSVCVCARRPPPPQKRKRSTAAGPPSKQSSADQYWTHRRPFCPASRQTCSKHNHASTRTDCLVFFIGRISSFPHLTPTRGVCLTCVEGSATSVLQVIYPGYPFLLYDVSLEVQNCAIHHQISAAVASFSGPSCPCFPLADIYKHQDASHV